MYNMKKNLYVLPLFLSISFFLASCQMHKRPAIGKEREIFVIADSIEYTNFANSLQFVFEKYIYTPQPEKYFTLIRKNFGELNKVKNKKNVIIIAPLNSESETSQYISEIFDSTSKAKVYDDKGASVNKYNLWHNNQLVMLITAPTYEDLNRFLLNNADRLLYAFQNISNKRLYESLYNPKYERKDIEAEILFKHYWFIYVQADFHLAINDTLNNFVWLRRAPGSEMERWIFVYYIENASLELLNIDSIKNIRNKITQKYYRTSDDLYYVVLEDDYFNSTEVNFNGRYSILLQGLWKMTDKGMGGPFINYSFYDEKQKRFYMLDGSIYAPKFRKRDIIQQLDVILNSFKTINEMSKEDIEKLKKILIKS